MDPILSQTNPVCNILLYFNIVFIIIIIIDRYSSVSIATRKGLDDPEIESRWGAIFSATVQTGTGAHPASYTVGNWSFPVIKRPGRGVDHPPHLAPRLKKE